MGRNSGETPKSVLFHLAKNRFINVESLAGSSVPQEYQWNKGYFTYSLQFLAFAGSQENIDILGNRASGKQVMKEAAGRNDKASFEKMI